MPSLTRSKEAAIDTVYIGAPASEYTLQDPAYLPLTSEVKQTDALGCEAIGLTSYRKNVLFLTIHLHTFDHFSALLLLSFSIPDCVVLVLSLYFQVLLLACSFYFLNKK